MRNTVLIILSVIFACSCSGVSDNSTEDNRFVVLGPSLVELMFAADLGERVVGVDRYSDWPEEAGELPQVGGIIDPSIEQIVALEPTSIHISGSCAILRDLAENLGVPCYSYDFDTLDDVFSSLDSLDARYGAGAAEFRNTLMDELDSLARIMESTVPVSVMIVIYHERGASSLTVAGGDTFFADILSSVNCEISAPGIGGWPMVSAEGVLDLSPEHIICLYPGRTDTLEIRRIEQEYWTGLGFEPDRIHCLFEPYIMIPGARIGRIAERMCSCLL